MKGQTIEEEPDDDLKGVGEAVTRHHLHEERIHEMSRPLLTRPIPQSTSKSALIFVNLIITTVNIEK